jgi:hypothetical protein
MTSRKIVGTFRTAGPLTTWKVSVDPDQNPQTHATNAGNYGAVWAKDNPLVQTSLCTITPVNGKNDEVINGYACGSGGANDDDLSVTWETSQINSGSASQHNLLDPDWFWMPTVSITDDRPIVQTKTGAGNWVDIGVDPEEDPDPATPENENDVRLSALFTWQSPTPPNPGMVIPLPNSSNTMGMFLGGTELPHTGGVQARVKVVLHIVVSGTGDNVMVTNWQVGVFASLITDIS